MRTFYYSTSNIPLLIEKYIAVGTGGTNRISSSNDGETWTSRSTTGSFSDIIWGSSKYIAVGTNSCYTSTDAITWTSRTIQNGYYRKIIYVNGLYVAVGGGISGNSRISTSLDGETWTSRSTTGTFYDVIWDGSKFITVGENSCYTSTDGITWTQQTIPNGQYRKIIYANGLYVAVGVNTNTIVTSLDGETWTSRLTTSIFYDIIWDGSMFIAVGGSCRTSIDGVTWTSRSIPSGSYRKILYINGLYVAVGTGTNSISTSLDGITWVSRLTIDQLYDVIWDGNKFITVGANACYTSTDGITWIEQTIPDGGYEKIMQKP